LSKTESLVNWFRQSAPYINVHRNKTFVIMLGGEAIAHPNINTIVHDIALVKSLGVRIVLVLGARPQIEEALEQNGCTTVFMNNIRITDDVSLPVIKQTVGLIERDIEAKLSMGLINSPMHNAHINTVRGNFITAQPIGVDEGIDYCLAGKVRRINHVSMSQQLDQGNLILVPPLGVSVTGEIFNLTSEDVATQVAIALKADKLISFCSHQGVRDQNNQVVSELVPEEATLLLESTTDDELSDSGTHRYLRAAIQCCNGGVERCHLVSYKHDGALLDELFSRDGIGTQLVSQSYERVRNATLDDIVGIIELIRPLEEQGVLVRRSRELLEVEINRFIVVERDRMIIGCAALYPFKDEKMAEMACMVSHPEYRRNSRGDRLLMSIIQRARLQGLTKLFVLTTKSIHWFQERGFELATLEDLPDAKRQMYNLQRRSKILMLDI
jgi:amino-acid N-acetyltransferase